MRGFPPVRRAVPFLALALLLLVPEAASAQPLFPNPVYPVGSNPYGLGMADFNRDGIQDLIAANYGAGNDGLAGDLSLLLGHGDGTFANETRVPTAQHATDVLAADINGDGVGDLIVTYSNSAQAVVMLGLGDGTFGPETLIADNVYQLFLADFNDDQVPDLLNEIGGADSGFQALLGQGDGTFTGVPPVSPGPTYNPIAADLNGDGRDDVLTVKYVAGEDPREILIYLGAGDGSFVPAGSLIAPDYIFSLLAADLDADGLVDLGVMTYHLHDSGFNEDVALYFSNGDGSFTAGPFEQEADAIRLIASDRNGDGIQDFVRVGFYDVTPYLGTGNRTFTKLPFFDTGAGVSRALPGDFDRDGRLDLAILANYSEAVFTYAGNGNGSFGPPIDPTLRDSYLGGVVTDDFNGDGRLDIAAAVLDQDQVAIELGHGDGTFGAETRFPAGIGPIFLASADMNGDGEKDLVAATRNWHFQTPDPIPTGSVVVLIGNGDGTFQTPVSYDEPGLLPGNAMHVRDLDGDGTPDVLIGNGTDYNGIAQPDLSFFHGNGDGTLSFVSHLSAGTVNSYPYGGWTFPMGLASGDFDHDGIRDIAVAVSGLVFGGATPGAARILRGLGGGAFAAPTTVADTVSSSALTVTDIDGNGTEDIVVADGGSGALQNGPPGGLYTLLNDGTGSFTQSALLNAGLVPMDVQVADMTGDGMGDLVVFNGAGYLTILPGLGGGAFGPGLNFGLFGAPLALLSGNFDGDAFRDLLVVSSSGTFVLHNQTPSAPALQIEAWYSFNKPIARGAVTVTWTTNAETDLIGFNIVEIDHRGRHRTHAALVPCEGCSDGRGHSYIFIIPKHHDSKNLYIEAVHVDHTIETFGPATRR